MRLHRLFPHALTVALLCTACAGSAALSSSSPSPAIVQVGLADRDTTVTLHVGDLLVVNLSNATPSPTSPPTIWRLTRYPTGILRLRPSDAKSGRFEFVAQATGEGSLTAVSGCSPGPLANDMAACPLVAGVADNVEILFSLTVHVT
jgi:hypothetical protein